MEKNTKEPLLLNAQQNKKATIQEISAQVTKTNNIYEKLNTKL